MKKSEFLNAVSAIKTYFATLGGDAYDYHIDERIVYRSLLACRFPEADSRSLELAASKIADTELNAAEMWDIVAAEVA